ncbi:copper homeostasis protein CutC [Treponema phagedenis]|uniref:copper homeostasis protein CutC n=1 Tax=Treponema phagedenis TaxID=162 RepID=UPI0001F63932|nr:copper homeostasis protein CutC [Treponema phagedenis]EFW36490.1 CutC family protein [Treponema phagedenis F0421]TYT78327.1 copper homeostasis protein CutC [Treponema phagedenis]
MKNITIEICAGSLDDALLAEKAGAQRIELNSSLFLGGLTPSLGTLRLVKQKTKLKVLTMVRPRAAGFLYTEAEFETMKEDARIFIENGADGIVFGFLNADGTLDAARCEALCKIANSRETVFHRAIDVVPDPLKTLDALIELGITRVLTSGQEPTAPEGAELIAEMVRHARGKIEILPGGGITKKNASRLVQETGVSQIHFAALCSKPEPSVQHNPKIYYGGALYPNEDRFEIADLDEMRRIIEKVN